LTNGADVAIPGMDRLDQVGQNLSVLDNLTPLSEEEMALLEGEKEKWSGNFCRRCDYCMPCPEGLNIPFLHTLDAYYVRYGLKEWAAARIEALPKSYKDCIACGQCTQKCPYHLDNAAIFQKALAAITPPHPA